MAYAADQSKERDLASLEGDGLLSRLGIYVPPFDLVGSLGVGRNEVAHSRLLAALLDPRKHRGAETMLRFLLRSILRLYDLEGGTGERLRTILGESWQRVEVRREFERIDIVVRILSQGGAVVVGIENKIDAAEGEEQLGRYQEALCRAYPKDAALLVFLTPTGREPTTAKASHPVRVVQAGYAVIASAAEEALRKAESGSRDEHSLSEVVAHLKENVLNEDTEVKEMVRELWKSHGRALRLAMKHRPRLEDVRDLYEALLRERFGNDAEISYWHPRGGLREIKMVLQPWMEAGFPFEFILHVDGNGFALVRLLIWSEHFDARANDLREWADRVEASDPGLVNPDFPKVRGWWSWRRVLVEEDYPADAILDEQAFDEATAREAVEAVVKLHEKLEPHVKEALTA